MRIMKKLLFCLQTMNMGGVEKELITVLKKIYDDYDITLLLLYQEDRKILADIPEQVNQVCLNIDKRYYVGSSWDLMKKRIRKGRMFEAVGIACKRALKIGMTGSNISFVDIPAYDDSFDTAICYHIHSPLLLKYVVEKVDAKKKIAWIHNDFFTSGYPVQQLRKLVVAYDEFVAVSRKVENEFRTLCPWYQGKISTAYNYMDADEILTLSQITVDDSAYFHKKCAKILTIGRFTDQKGIDYAIEATAMLKKDDIDFHWFLIGYGELENKYHQLIEKYGVADRFTILGKKTNPYPYLKDCDIYVQPSRHEAYPLTIMEAKILKRPILCTNFDGADEQIENGVNGIIVPVNDVDALFKEVKKMVLSEETRIKLAENLQNWNITDELEKIVSHF